MTSQADKFNIRSHKGAAKRIKYMTRDAAELVATERNSRALSANRGAFGNGLFRVLKDGPINAPFWIVTEAR